jgi:hypothetical protein
MHERFQPLAGEVTITDQVLGGNYSTVLVRICAKMFKKSKVAHVPGKSRESVCVCLSGQVGTTAGH